MSSKFLKCFSLPTILFSFLLVSWGCDNNKETELEDTTRPVINITSPQPNDLIVAGVGDIIVEGTLTDDRELAECTIIIAYTGLTTQGNAMNNFTLKGASTGDLVAGIDDEPFAHDPVLISLTAKSYSFSSNYKPFGTIGVNVKFGEYTITFTVLDEAGNEAVEELKIQIGQ